MDFTPEIGSVIRDRYEVVGHAGAGGQGLVVQAVDQVHDRQVAIKVRPTGTADERDALLAEARWLMAIEPHPNVQVVREDFFEGDTYFLVSDWIDGEDLGSLLRETGDPGIAPTAVLGWLDQLAAALDHLHAQDPPVVHGDVKPPNLIVRKDGRLVLVDFGIAGQSGGGSSAGTAGFMAPETGSDRTAAADIYSFAATGYALLTGAPPGGGAPSFEGIDARAAASIERALRGALAIDPRRRPRRASEVAEALRGWIGALPAGTVTYLLTEVEGSAAAWEREPERMRRAMARHDALIESAVESNSGHVVRPRGEGDSRFCVFARALDAIAAARDIQRALGAQPWKTDAPIRVRISLHTGEAELRGGDYYGTAVNRCARIRALAHGGQTLMSYATEELAREHLPPDLSLRDLGEQKLKDLSHPERIFQLDIAGMSNEFPALLSSERRPTNLPAQLSTLVGRGSEVGEVAAMLATERLVTIAGPGGVGKTRLAIHSAAEAMDDFGDGVWMAGLASIDDDDKVAVELAGVFGLIEDQGSSHADSLVRHLREQQALLVIDNCEHVVQGAAALIERLLNSCQGLRVLATSRERIGVPGEVVFPLYGLAVPGDQADVESSPSVQLFVERATAVKRAFRLGENDHAAVASICRRLDGLPLAIELAAARVSSLSVTQIAERLDDMFRLLTGGARTALPHHQTLRATVDWSHQLLSEPERMLFRRLAIFAPGVPLGAIENVCASDELDAYEILDRIGSLVDKSMVVAEENDDGIRYSMLQTVHGYAREQLREADEEDALAAKHLDFFAAEAAQTAQQLSGPDQVRWLDSLESSHANIRRALDHAIANTHAIALSFVNALSPFWALRGHLSEGRAFIDRALALPIDAPATTRARALDAAGTLASKQGSFEEARSLFAHALSIFETENDEPGTARELSHLGGLTYMNGDRVSGQRHLEQAMEIGRRIGDDRLLVDVTSNLAIIVHEGGDPDRASELFGESLTVARRLGDTSAVADLLGNVGFLAQERGELESARELHEESLALRRTLGDRAGIANSLSNLATIAAEQGHLEEARSLANEGLRLAKEIGDLHAEADAEAFLSSL